MLSDNRKSVKLVIDTGPTVAKDNCALPVRSEGVAILYKG